MYSTNIAQLPVNQQKDKSTGDIRDKILVFFSNERDLVADQQRPKVLEEKINVWEQTWLQGWLTEFTCDLLATYFVGPAYAWTNLKLSAAERPEDIYESTSLTHPSHEARMRIINCMLYILGYFSEAEEIKQEWNVLLTLPAYQEPDYYTLAFPDELLSALAENVYHSCCQLGFLSYQEQVDSIHQPVSLVMNQAWDVLRKNPEAFQKWEAQNIEDLKTIM